MCYDEGQYSCCICCRITGSDSWGLRQLKKESQTKTDEDEERESEKKPQKDTLWDEEHIGKNGGFSSKCSTQVILALVCLGFCCSGYINCNPKPSSQFLSVH